MKAENAAATTSTTPPAAYNNSFANIPQTSLARDHAFPPRKSWNLLFAHARNFREFSGLVNVLYRSTSV